MATNTDNVDINYDTTSATELDSHADSPVVGKYAHILEYTSKNAKVSRFTSELGKPIEVPIVTAAIAYDCEYTGSTYIMVIHHALYVKSMEINLIPPIMMRIAGLYVDECPKFLSPCPTDTNHSITLPDADVRIPLQLNGTISYFPTRYPTSIELKENEGNYLLLSPNLPEWNPHTEEYRDQEYAMVDYNGNIKESKLKRADMATRLIMSSMIERNSIDMSCDPGYFIHTITTLGTTTEERNVDAFRVDKKAKRIDAETLSKRLNIPIEMAKKTLRATTQYATRSTNEPALTRKYRTNDRILRYARMYCDTFMDTFVSSKDAKSIRGFKSAQVFVTEFGHVFVVLMEDKSGKNIALAIKEYFREKGVPIHLICDQAREQVKGDARILCHDAGCTIIELEKGTPSANRAERTIKILKDETKNDLFKSNAPLCLWCYCIERRVEIINSTCRSNPLLHNETPHTKLTGQPTDISSICEYEWYEWVIYRVEGKKYPFQHQRIGRVLGLARNAGNAMSQWILTDTGDIMPIQTLRPLTAAEKNSPSMKTRLEEFDAVIKKKLGDCLHRPNNDAVNI